MFNGIIFNQGVINKIIKRDKGIDIFVKSNLKLTNKDIGVSVSCDGVCLTLIAIKKKIMEFYLSNETIKRSKFKFLKTYDKINLELPLKYGQKISGHFVQGHVDTTAVLTKIFFQGKTWILNFSLKDKKLYKFMVEKASICINGVSLTISNVKNNSFEINIIPHTLKLTNLKNLKLKSIVNIELDIFVKYILKVSK